MHPSRLFGQWTCSVSIGEEFSSRAASCDSLSESVPGFFSFLLGNSSDEADMISLWTPSVWECFLAIVLDSGDSGVASCAMFGRDISAPYIVSVRVRPRPSASVRVRPRPSASVLVRRVRPSSSVFVSVRQWDIVWRNYPIFVFSSKILTPKFLYIRLTIFR